MKGFGNNLLCITVRNCEMVFILLQVLSSGSPMIAYEVTLSVQRLVKKYGKDLPSSTWDIILDILETVLKQLDVCI